MKVRKQQQVDAFRQRILDTAKAIMKEEGMESISIRKITNQLDYTPGILYHYFKNKDAIIEAIVKEGYQDIVAILQTPQEEHVCASIQFANRIRAYMQAMLERREIFMLLVNSRQPQIAAQVDLLMPNIRKHRKSMDLLCRGIEAGIASGEFVCEHVELRAQTIWCATYGVIMRICKEEVKDELQNQLIEEHIQMILVSLQVR